jgi:hypothetical protein
MIQDELFYQDVYRATEAACRVIGGGGKEWAKVCGHMLWPEKDPDDAGAYLNNCLDKTRRERLNPQQFLLVAREAKRRGCHVLMAFICDDTEYQRTNPIEPEDQRAAIQIRAEKLVSELSSLVNRLERIG